MKELPWHHLHVTVEDRENAALWHEYNTFVKRGQPTKRSENLYYGPNLLQLQSKAVGPKPHNAFIDSIGVEVSDFSKTINQWKSAGGIVSHYSENIANLVDPWGIPYEYVEGSDLGYTHVNILTEEPVKFFDWYQSNLGGKQSFCSWDRDRLVIAYDTMLIMIISTSEPITITDERPLDHLGWYTENLDNTYHFLLEKGVKFPVLPRKFGSVRLAFAEDPFGNWIELLEPPNKIINKKKY